MKNKIALVIGFFLMLGCAHAQSGLESFGKKVMAYGYSYTATTGTTLADGNVWTMVCLSCTVGATSRYLGNYDVWLVPHGGDGEFLITPAGPKPLFQGFPISQSKTAEVVSSISNDQVLWIRGGGLYWDILVGWMKELQQ